MNQTELPPEGGEIRTLARTRVEEAASANGEKMTIDWRGEPKHLYVVSVPVHLLYYNPETHRIRAQRTLDPARDRVLDEDPWGGVGQDYLDTLLKCQPSDPTKVDPDFEALRDNLENFGQLSPGLITVGGVLVNGNTRCAALRELGEPNIRVGVLPESTQWDDISSVELALQLRREHKRDYSYINRLIAIDEQIKLGRRPEDIARTFHIKVSTLDQDRWVYALIQDAISRSKSDGGASMRLIDFENDQEKLKELQRLYVKVAQTDRDGAEALKESRLGMIVLGYAKTDVRFAQPDFHSKYLDSKLPDALKSAVPSGGPGELSIPGLPGVTVPDAPASVKVARELTDTLLKARAAAAGGGTGGQAGEAKKTLADAKDAIDRALTPAGRDARLQQRKLAAPDRLSDACDDIELCAQELAHSRAYGALDEAAFDDAVLRLRSVIQALARQSARAFREPGDGVSWLIGVGADVDAG